MQYLKLYNSSKHDIPEHYNHHLFSPSDAILTYFVFRRMSIKFLLVPSLIHHCIIEFSIIRMLGIDMREVFDELYGS